MSHTYNETHYALCDCCGDECHIDNIHDWHGAPVCPTCFDSEHEPCRICGVALREHDGDNHSCGDCVHDCVHIYDDAEPDCVRCGYIAPAPGSHLRLILGGRK